MSRRFIFGLDPDPAVFGPKRRAKTAFRFHDIPAPFGWIRRCDPGSRRFIIDVTVEEAFGGRQMDLVVERLR
jgi:hypothetical protein